VVGVTIGRIAAHGASAKAVEFTPRPPRSGSDPMARSSRLGYAHALRGGHMRPLLLSFLVIPCLACLGLFSGDNFEREACDAYLDCLAEVDPGGFAAATSVYGVGGSCWEAAPDNCERACSGAQAAVAQLHEDNQTCNPDWQSPPPFRPTFGVYSAFGQVESNTCSSSRDPVFFDWDIQGAGAQLRIRDLHRPALDWRCDLMGRDFFCSITRTFQPTAAGTVEETIEIDARWIDEEEFDGAFVVGLRCVSGNCEPYPQGSCAVTYALSGELD